MAKTVPTERDRGLESYFPADGDAACRRAANDQRKPGGQPGNRNAVEHGRRTAEAQRKRKLAHAGLKVLQHLLNSQGMVPRSEGRMRPRPIRADQMNLLLEAEPQLAALVRAAGVYLPDLFRGPLVGEIEARHFVWVWD